jgi:hypothetical protein
MPGDRFYGLPVDGDLVVVGIDENAFGRRGLAVDANASRRDQLVRGAAAGDAGAREEAVQPFLVSDRPLVDLSVTSRSTLGLGR